MEYISRKEFVEELQLREYIRKVLQEWVGEQEKEVLEEQKLRKMIRRLLETEVEDEIPHHQTGINVLETLLKKIIPTLEEGYKSLTSDYMQRKSFKAHILNAVINLLEPSLVRDSGNPDEEAEEKEQAIVGLDEGLIYEEEDDITVTVGDEEEDKELPITDEEAKISEDDKEKFIDVKKTGSKKASADHFSIPGEDLTGRNMALQIFEKIEKQILDSYGVLGSEEDRDVFIDYLITNLRLYFEKFEDELLPAVEEPEESESYKRAKEEELPGL